VITIEGGTFAGALEVNEGSVGKIVVSGGWFDAQVPAGYCAEGLEPTTAPDAETGLYTVQPAAPACPDNWSVQEAPSQALADAYAAWAAVEGNDPTAENAESAFLLGQNVAGYTPLAATAIVVNADGTVSIDTTVDLTQVRGRLYVAWAATPDAAAADWTKVAATPDAGDASQVSGIDAAASAKFFKVGVDYAEPAPASVAE
jgi:hypothetical protein